MLKKPRLFYALLFFALLVTEVLIALFVHDSFIRPFFVDVLVTVLICCLVRIFFPEKIKLLPLWVFLFAAAVEVGQYFDYVTLLGLGDIEFFRILLGTSFSAADILCYGIGCLLFFGAEWLGKFLEMRRKK